ncbi:hypothetical protein HK101_008057 [Irineochytrium annulatum]|nr:hypothetical protein HK101_008057 [Irineochytrium annulatum]
MSQRRQIFARGDDSDSRLSFASAKMDLEVVDLEAECEPYPESDSEGSAEEMSGPGSWMAASKTLHEIAESHGAAPPPINMAAVAAAISPTDSEGEHRNGGSREVSRGASSEGRFAAELVAGSPESIPANSASTTASDNAPLSRFIQHGPPAADRVPMEGPPTSHVHFNDLYGPRTVLSPIESGSPGFASFAGAFAGATPTADLDPAMMGVAMTVAHVILLRFEPWMAETSRWMGGIDRAVADMREQMAALRSEVAALSMAGGKGIPKALDGRTGQPLLQVEREMNDAKAKLVEGSLAYQQIMKNQKEREEANHTNQRMSMAVNSKSTSSSARNSTDKRKTLLQFEGFNFAAVAAGDVAAKIESVPKRQTCVRCDGIGYFHDPTSQKKHNTEPDVQCKKCMTCTLCTGTGIIMNATPCDTCNSNGHIHPDSAACTKGFHCDACKPCTKCSGKGLIPETEAQQAVGGWVPTSGLLAAQRMSMMPKPPGPRPVSASTSPSTISDSSTVAASQPSSATYEDAAPGKGELAAYESGATASTIGASDMISPQQSIRSESSSNSFVPSLNAQPTTVNVKAAGAQKEKEQRKSAFGSLKKAFSRNSMHGSTGQLTGSGSVGQLPSAGGSVSQTNLSSGGSSVEEDEVGKRRSATVLNAQTKPGAQGKTAMFRSLSTQNLEGKKSS